MEKPFTEHRLFGDPSLDWRGQEEISENLLNVQIPICMTHAIVRDDRLTDVTL